MPNENITVKRRFLTNNSFGFMGWPNEKSKRINVNECDLRPKFVVEMHNNIETM